MAHARSAAPQTAPSQQALSVTAAQPIVRSSAPLSPPPPPPPPPPFSPPPQAKPFNLEWLIGTKGLAAAGALAVVIGVIFFLKYAVDQGWIGHLPPLFRCMVGVGFGGLLVAAGEVVRRKVNALGGAGLYAAGIACAYASVYAGYGYFNPPVIPQGVAFVALALISALGIALSAGTRLASVAIVSLVGAYLAPFLMASRNPNPLVFPVYACILLATGLVLAAWLRDTFRWVGRSVWWATMIIGGGWAAFNLYDYPVIVIGFVLAVWTMIHTAHIVAARGGFTSGSGSPPAAGTLTLRGSGPMLSSFSVTSWMTVLLTLALRRIDPALDWLAPCGVTAATGTLAVWLAGHLGVVKNPPRTDAERLGASLVLQAAAALIATVAMLTSSSGPAAALLWMSMGVGAIATGRWAKALAVTLYGTILLMIGTTRLVLWDSWQGRASLFSPTLDAFGLALSPWAAWAGLAALAWFAAAWIISLGTPAGRFSIWGALKAAVGVILLVAAVVHPQSAPHATTWVVLLICAALIGLHTARRQLALHVHCVVLLSLTTLKIVMLDALSGRVTAEAPRLLGLPLTHSLWLCIGAAVAWGVLALAARATINVRPHAVAKATACSMVALFMLMLAPVTQDVVESHLVWPWAFVSLIATLVSRAEPRLGLRTAATAAAMLSGCAWVVSWVFLPGFAHWSTQFPVLLHPGLLSACAVVGVLIAVASVSRDSSPPSGSPLADVLPGACLIAAGALAWLATSFEASRAAEIVTGSAAARGAAVSIWWGLLAVTLLWIGFRRAFAGLRYAGLTLLGLAGVKIVLLDMAGAPQLARVAGFVTLGLLMLGAAVGYARVTKSLAAPKRHDDDRPQGADVR